MIKVFFVIVVVVVFICWLLHNKIRSIFQTSDTVTSNEFSISTNTAQSGVSVTPKNRSNLSPLSSSSSAAAAAAAAGRHATNMSTQLFPIATQSSVDPLASLSNAEDLEIKPGIAEMIREEERVS